jgi:hypothetical protein
MHINLMTKAISNLFVNTYLNVYKYKVFTSASEIKFHLLSLEFISSKKLDNTIFSFDFKIYRMFLSLAYLLFSMLFQWLHLPNE